MTSFYFVLTCDWVTESKRKCSVHHEIFGANCHQGKVFLSRQTLTYFKRIFRRRRYYLFSSLSSVSIEYLIEQVFFSVVVAILTFKYNHRIHGGIQKARTGQWFLELHHRTPLLKLDLTNLTFYILGTSATKQFPSAGYSHALVTAEQVRIFLRKYSTKKQVALLGNITSSWKISRRQMFCSLNVEARENRACG